MTYKREDFGVAYDQDEQVIYVLGGYSYGMFYDSAMANCEKYSIRDDKWTEIKPMSIHKQGVSACIFDNKSVYAIGGFNGSYLEIIEKFDIYFNLWETIEIISDVIISGRFGAFVH